MGIHEGGCAAHMRMNEPCPPHGRNWHGGRLNGGSPFAGLVEGHRCPTLHAVHLLLQLIGYSLWCQCVPCGNGPDCSRVLVHKSTSFLPIIRSLCPRHYTKERLL